MKYVKYQNADKRKGQLKLIIILASVLLFLLVATIVTKIVVDNLSSETPPHVPPEYLEGEGLLNGYYLLAYPQVEVDKINDVVITTPDGTYGIERDEASGNVYVKYMPEGSEQLVYYLPPIVNAEGNFDYSSLFAVSDVVGGEATNVYYLCSVISTLYFDERIQVSAEEKDEIYRYYGLTAENAKIIVFSYKDADGTEKTHKITIGDNMLTGAGYYYTVDDRPYIYVTTSTYIDYALGGASSLINSMLVSEGLAKDSYLEPYLSPEYTQWKTTLHENAEDTVAAGSVVIVDAQILSPQNPAVTDDPDSFVSGGYLGEGFIKTEFDLSKYTDEKYAAMLAALVGKNVGSYEGSEIVFTVVGSSFAANIPDGEDSVEYTYTVTAIEAILDGGEKSSVGTPVGSNKLLKVTYTATVGEESVTPTSYHAVINLENALIPADALAAFSAASVGELATPIEFSVTYSKDNTENQTVSQIVITEINKIYEVSNGGSSVVEVDTVGANCIIAYTYVIKVGSQKSQAYKGYIDLSDEDAGEYARSIGELLMGCGKGELEEPKVADTYIEYPEVMADFDTVTVKNIGGYVTSELVVSFAFKNDEFRDPFYGESLYENTLTNANRNYGLNNTVCQTVLSILGGVGDNSNSTDGFIGSETVAIGLDTATMLKYGLYGEGSHRIHFVLPRDIDETGPTDDEIFYEWTSTLEFTLYISAEQEGGFRYVGSDMYDIVAKVESSELVFLNYEFLDFWARRSPLLLDVEDITSFKLNLNMPTVYGEYEFTMKHTDYYYDVNGNKYMQPGDGRTHDTFIEMRVSEAEDSMESALSEYIRENSQDGSVDFSLFYGNGVDEYIEYDTTDVYYFEEVLYMLYMTTYVDRLTEQEQTAAGDVEPFMSFELSLRDHSAAKYDTYIYEFRRFDDRRVMVTIKSCRSGSVIYESSDFYISTASVREVVTGFVYLINGMEVSSENVHEQLPTPSN